MSIISKTWKPIIHDVESAERHFEQAARLFEKLIAVSPHHADTYETEMAFQHAMQSGYTSIESAIKKIFVVANEELPIGSSSHAELLKDAFEDYGERPAIFYGREMFEILTLLKNFRHVAAHSYDDFSLNLARPSASAAAAVRGKLRSQAREFIEKFDGPINDPKIVKHPSPKN